MWRNRIKNITENSKLHIYGKLKSEIKIEQYLLEISNFKTRQLFTKFRVSDHKLEIETGRYQNIPRDKRLCKFCNSNEIDDEYHFLLNCNKNKLPRDQLFLLINQLNPHFIQDQPLQKLKQILNPNFELLSAVGNFLKQGIDLRG